MDMDLQLGKIKQLREDKGWTQSQLAEFCGVNLRTIQRAEKTHTCSLETLNALISVFEVEREEIRASSEEATSASTPDKTVAFATETIGKEVNASLLMRLLHNLRENIFYVAANLWLLFLLVCHIGIYLQVNLFANEENKMVNFAGISIAAETIKDSATGTVSLPIFFYISFFATAILLIGCVKRQWFLALLAMICLPMQWLMLQAQSGGITPVTIFTSFVIGYVFLMNYQKVAASASTTKTDQD